MSDAEAALAWQLHAAGIPEPVREYRFHPDRKWRADFAWPDRMLLLEVDGGAWIGGRHTSGSGFEADARKVSEAAALGWRVLRCTPRMVETGECLGLVERALGRKVA